MGTADVVAALKSGKVVRSTGLAVYRRDNLLAGARLALIVPKKLVPTAVQRNRIRRLAREAFRLQQDDLAGFDYLVRVTRPLDRPGPGLADLQALMKRARHAR